MTPLMFSSNETFQVTYKAGDMQKEEDKKYLWLGNKYHGKPSPYIAPSSLASNAMPPEVGLLKHLLKSIQNCYGTLTPAVLLTQGSQVIYMHTLSTDNEN